MTPLPRTLRTRLVCITLCSMMPLALSAAGEQVGPRRTLSTYLDERGFVDMDALLRAVDQDRVDLRGFRVFGRTPVDRSTFERIETLESTRLEPRRNRFPEGTGEVSCWSDSFPLPYVNGRIRATVLYQGNLVIGGDFTVAGKTTNYIAAWTGSRWLPLGSGLNGPVSALAVFDGALVAGGDFTLAGGIWANRIARWDGASWNSLGQGTSGPVYDLTSWNGDLVATGDFMVAGQVYANGIGSWNGSAWSPLGDGLDEQGEVLAVYQDSLLVVAGGFSAAGTTIAEGIASWNGSTWRALGPGPWSGSIRAMVEHEGMLIVGGDFEEIGLARVPYLAAWNGTAWQQYAGAIELPVVALHVFGGALTCAFESGPRPLPFGSVLEIATWDGFTWTTTLRDDDTETTIPVLTDFQGQLLAAWAENDNFGGLAFFDGVDWLALIGPGLSDDVHSIIESEGDLIVCGNFSQAGTVPAYGVARWNGTSWDSLGSGVAGNNGNDSFDAHALATLGTDLYLGGRFTFTTSPGDTVHNIARWDGVHWGPVGSGVNGEIQTAAVHDGVLYVGGLFTEAGGVSVSNVAAWDGTTWSSPGAGLPGFVSALLSYDTLLVAGGPAYYDGQQYFGDQAVFAWDGSSWSSLGSSSWSDVHTLASYNGELIIGGRLEPFGSAGIQGVARWDGAGWQALGSGLSIQGSDSDVLVHALTVYDGKLIAGGSFLQAGGSPAARIAAWDGSSWLPIDSGIGTWTDNSSEVLCLASWAGQLAIGGSFSIAGGMVSASLALYGCGIPVSTTLEEELHEFPSRLVASPNPFRVSTRIDFQLSARSPVTLEVYDAGGRRVRRLMRSLQQGPGLHAALWDGRTDLGQPVPTGIYFYRLQTNAGTWTGKTVRVR